MADMVQAATDLFTAPFQIGLGIANTVRGFQQDAYQREQDQWSKDQYIENRDYQRALQKEIFAREDTAVQRALDDYTNAGFSPLAAIGQNYDAGQAISGSVAPQATATNFGGQALAEAYKQSGAVFQELLKGAQTLKEIGAKKDADIIVDAAKHELDMEKSEQEHLQRVDEITHSATASESLARLQAQLQSDAREDSQRHDKDMSEMNHQNAVNLMESTYDKQIDSASALSDPNARVARKMTAKDLLNSDDPLLRAYGDFLTTTPYLRENPEEQARYIQLMIDQVAANNANAQRNMDNFNKTASTVTGAVNSFK